MKQYKENSTPCGTQTEQNKKAARQFLGLHKWSFENVVTIVTSREECKVTGINESS